jgi:cytochrome P450
MLGNDLISTIEPANLKALLATQFNDFGLGIRHRQFYPLLDDGIFTLDGHGWSSMRALIRPQFAREQVSNIYPLPGVRVKMRNNKKDEIQQDHD